MQIKTLILSTVITVIAVPVYFEQSVRSQPTSASIAQAPTKSAGPSSEHATSAKTNSTQSASSHEYVPKEKSLRHILKGDNFQRYRRIDLPPPKFYFLDSRLEKKVAFDARTEFTLARCAVQENQPEKAESYFKGTIETLKAKEHDPKFENEVYEAYASFLNSEHRPDEAKALLEQLRAKQRIAPKPKKK